MANRISHDVLAVEWTNGAANPPECFNLDTKHKTGAGKTRICDLEAQSEVLPFTPAKHSLIKSPRDWSVANVRNRAMTKLLPYPSSPAPPLLNLERIGETPIHHAGSTLRVSLPTPPSSRRFGTYLGGFLCCDPRNGPRKPPKYIRKTVYTCNWQASKPPRTTFSTNTSIITRLQNTAEQRQPQPQHELSTV
jgi:hypothetical protein